MLPAVAGVAEVGLLGMGAGMDAGAGAGDASSSDREDFVQTVVDVLEDVLVTIIEGVRERPGVAGALLAGLAGVVAGTWLAARQSRPKLGTVRVKDARARRRHGLHAAGVRATGRGGGGRRRPAQGCQERLPAGGQVGGAARQAVGALRLAGGARGGAAAAGAARAAEPDRALLRRRPRRAPAPQAPEVLSPAPRPTDDRTGRSLVAACPPRVPARHGA